jgi:integrase
MPRPMHKLSQVQIGRAMKQQCTLNDGGGLYFVSRPPNGASWIFRFSRHGKDRWMGIGQYPTVTLKDARARATDARQLLSGDVDPIENRRQQRAQTKLQLVRQMTFAQCAALYITSHKTAWRNAKHSAQWDATLKTYVYPLIGSLPVAAVDTSLVMKVLQPIWNAKPETASRLRGRIEAILNWATVSEFRTGLNPARWRGHLDNLLPARSKIARVEHHAALPYADVPAFMVKLLLQEGVAARALEFLILTAARTGEVIGARWSEINLREKLWTIPAERMKAGKEHRVPLSSRAIEILEAIHPDSSAADGFVFPGNKAKKPLSNMAFLMLLRRMKCAGMTAHGLRSSFRDWCAERTNFPSEVAEMALAHAVGNKVEAAYRRGDLYGKRQQLMDHWATFCASPAPVANTSVIRIREAVS